MSLKKSKIDLLVRVRYANPIPPPPSPPKLLAIPTDPLRYTSLAYTKALADETPLPMIIDAEMGMPIDLTQWESLWIDGGDDADINPDPSALPLPDPKDAWMLSDSLTSSTNGASSSNIPSINVSWLRKTEYISRETRPLHTPEIKMSQEVIDISLPSQIASIESSFARSHPPSGFNLSTIKHPGNPRLTAVESWEVFPDEDVWANTYDLFKFAERPGDRVAEKDDPRLDCALLRPRKEDDETFLAYYLVKDDESIEKLQLLRRDAEVLEDQENTMKFDFVRDYEPAKVEQGLVNEFLLTYRDDDPTSDASGDEDGDEEDIFGEKKAKTSGKGKAFYKNIERKFILKKKRVNKLDQTYDDKWDVIQLSYKTFTAEEEAERKEAVAEVAEVGFAFRPPPQNEEGVDGGGGQADGEVMEVDD